MSERLILRRDTVQLLHDALAAIQECLPVDSLDGRLACIQECIVYIQEDLDLHEMTNDGGVDDHLTR